MWREYFVRLRMVFKFISPVMNFRRLIVTHFSFVSCYCRDLHDHFLDWILYKIFSITFTFVYRIHKTHWRTRRKNSNPIFNWQEGHSMILLSMCQFCHKMKWFIVHMFISQRSEWTGTEWLFCLHVQTFDLFCCKNLLE